MAKTNALEVILKQLGDKYILGFVAYNWITN